MLKLHEFNPVTTEHTAMSNINKQAADVSTSMQGHVAIVEMRRPPHNYFDAALIAGLADAFEAREVDPSCRAIVLCSQGTAFCAGASLSTQDSKPGERSPREVNPIYHEALRLFACTKPVMCAMQGAAIGGGLGLALVCDFRVTCVEGRFSANFTRLGFHPGFGLSLMLPRLIIILAIWPRLARRCGTWPPGASSGWHFLAFQRQP